MTRASASARGFTLLEVVIALSLLAFGMALTLGTLRGATRATANAEDAAQRGERLRAVQGLLRRQVGAALPMAMAIDPESGEAQIVHGERDQFEWVGSMPGYLSRGGPYVQQLELVRVAGGSELRFQHRLLTPDGPLDPEREPSVLLTGIEDGGFQYRSLDDQGRPGPWQETWPSASTLPPLVRLRLTFKASREHWPDLVIAPKLATAQAPVPVQAIAAPDADPNR
jgi:general secretion pathway protein J